MKVKELIKHLENCNPEHEVFYHGDGKWIILEVTQWNGEVQLQC